jgi:SH3 domain-containing YSC84-like protein 1
MKTNGSGFWVVLFLVAVVLFAGGAGVARGADDAAKSDGTFEKTQAALGSSDARQARQIVDKAQMTLENFGKATQMNAFRDLLKDAKAIYVSPGLMKFAFIFGALGGNGVLMVKDDKTGEWSGPAFYTMGGGSFGLQIGGQSSEVVLLAMTNRGVTSLLSSSFKLGADASIAAGPVGMGASAATVNVSADILSFARAKGAFAGISLDGTVIKVRNGMNVAYYGGDVTPTDILVKRTVRNPHSDRLIAEVSRDTSSKGYGSK